MSDLDGRAVIVTGAGKGLGRAYALHLAAKGARVLVNNRRHAGEADADTSAAKAVAEIIAAGGAAVANWEDVAAPGAGARMIEAALTAFGRIDAVVANAAVAAAAPVHKTSDGDFRAVFDPGFFGTLGLVQAAWPHLRKAGAGRLALTASSAGLYGVHGMAAYAASKAAVIALMRTLAIEGASSGVRANVIMPYAYSQMTAPHMDAAQKSTFDPALVSPLVGWLASATCTVSGEIFVCGGGRIARAAAGETASIPFEPSRIAEQAAELAAAPTYEHRDATAAYDAFMGAKAS